MDGALRDTGSATGIEAPGADALDSGTSASHDRHRPDATAATYVYDGTLEGFLTCIFTAFERKETPVSICADGCVQMSLFGSTENIVTDMEKAERVMRGLQRKLGDDEANRIKLAFLSDDPDRGIKLLRYIQIAMKKGRYAYCDHANPVVADYEKLWRRVSNERHDMLQFTRFSEIDDGVFFAKINPNANVVPVMMVHFARRFNTESFAIYDEVHHIAGISQNGKWQLLEVSQVSLPSPTEEDDCYRKMWKTFYDSVCNPQRLNPALRRSYMPKRMWSNIVEVCDELPRKDDGTIDAEPSAFEVGTEGASGTDSRRR